MFTQRQSKRRFLAAFILVCVCAFPVRAGTPSMAIELDARADATLESIKKLEREFYTVDYQADYALDEALARGMESPKALEAFVSEKLIEGLPFNFRQIRLACSTFAADFPGGDHFMARNMDMSYAKNFLVHTKPVNGYESMSMVPGHMLGYTSSFPYSKLGRLWTLAAPYYPFDGINEKGLSVAILLVADKVVRQDTGKPPVTTTMAVRMLLDKAATVEEALALMAEHDMRSMANTNFHFHLVDAGGDSAVVEYVDERINIVRPSGYGHPVTNFYLTPGLREVVQDGQDRMDILEKSLNENKGVVTARQAWDMLDSVKAVHDYDEVNNIDFMTAYSILYNNSKRSMDICIEAKFDKVYSFSFDGWGKK